MICAKKVTKLPPLTVCDLKSSVLQKKTAVIKFVLEKRDKNDPDQKIVSKLEPQK
jgi:hypothetical protein